MMKKFKVIGCLLVFFMTFLLVSCSTERMNSDSGRDKDAVSERDEAPNDSDEASENDSGESNENDDSSEPDGGKAEDSNVPNEKTLNIEVYQNTRYGFSLSYPDIYDTSFESDNGDGVTMESKDGRYSLLLWAN